MSFSYKFTNLLGCVYRKGNLLFTADGNNVISPVGNRISIFDLKNNKSETLQIESRYNFTTIALSPNGYLLFTVNEVGEGYLFSLTKKILFYRHHFKRPVKDVQFSPNGRYIAVTKENIVFLYKIPTFNTKEYNPFILDRVFSASCDDTMCLDWSSDSQVLAVGSKDLTTKIYAVNKFSNLSVYTLGSHKDTVISCFFEENSLDLYTLSRNDQLCVWECSIDLDGLIPSKKEGKIQKIEELETDNDEHSEKQDESMESSEKVYYKRLARYNLKDNLKATGYVTLSSAAYHKKSHILVVGFSVGSFILLEMPQCNLIHSLNVSDQAISSLAFNCTGDWLAIGCSDLGQLVIWEWQSESFVLKQQNHFNNLNCLSYSPNGQYIATGGEDGKIKVWNVSSGFCFVTFTEHTSGITGITFTNKSTTIVSASLDGTVRLFDLHRYRNFRTCTSPKSNQFVCLAVDPLGEIICAGSKDSFEIFVWSVKNGHLLDILASHEAPISSLSFSPNQSIMISGSLDNTIRIWDIFERKGRQEAITMLCDVLAVEFRPDGQEFAAATINGQISFFNTESNTQVGSIDSRDLEVGRKDFDLITAKKLQAAAFFTTLCYTRDGNYLLAAGKSKNVCIYHVKEQILLKKFEITGNHSFDGIESFISQRKMTEFGNKALIEERDDESNVAISLPGVRKGDMAARAFKPEIKVSGIQFSPTGRSWAATTTEGLLIYSLDCTLVFEPFNLEEDITPSSIRQLLQEENFSDAFINALRLNKSSIIIEVMETIPVNNVEVIAKYMPHIYVERLLNFLADHLDKTKHIEFYLTWVKELLTSHGILLKERSSQMSSTFCTLQKICMQYIEDLGKICDYNKYSLEYIISMGRLQEKQAALNENVNDNLAENMSDMELS
ncbi:periodic tryptophan protein 2 homolog [Centruroides vittatus]|uniref:periodic tryptophan protein 2 homolog n=1 Tax=Centruroides vittatus TaxID=120091 RepID=UPI0035101AD7